MAASSPGFRFAGLQRMSAFSGAHSRPQPVIAEGKVPKGLDQVGMAAGGHRQDELQLAAVPASQGDQFPDVFQAQGPGRPP